MDTSSVQSVKDRSSIILGLPSVQTVMVPALQMGTAPGAYTATVIM